MVKYLMKYAGIMVFMVGLGWNIDLGVWDMVVISGGLVLFVDGSWDTRWSLIRYQALKRVEARREAARRKAMGL
jgi:hypothetical protein